MLADDRIHYKQFDEVYGTETTDDDRPTATLKKHSRNVGTVDRGAKKAGHNTPNAAIDGEPGSSQNRKSQVRPKSSCVSEADLKVYDKAVCTDAGMYTAQNARALIECVECRKPHIVYCRGTTWCSRYRLELALLLSENDFTCGSPITPPGHMLHGKIYTRLNISCADHIELAYYCTSNAIGT